MGPQLQHVVNEKCMLLFTAQKWAGECSGSPFTALSLLSQC